MKLDEKGEGKEFLKSVISEIKTLDSLEYTADNLKRVMELTNLLTKQLLGKILLSKYYKEKKESNKARRRYNYEHEIIVN